MSRLFRILDRRQMVISLCVGLLLSAIAWSQQPAAYSRSTAIDQKDSRAEHEAEQLVSLSAERILGILHDEPGLLLQIKRALVRRAFEQGRILNPDELTDDALFSLIREDQNTRIIATKEIVDRSYIKAKPTREEVARDLPCRQPMPTGTGAAAAKQPDQSANPNAKTMPSQEEQYWRKHEDDLDCYLTQYLPYGVAPYSFGPGQFNQALSSQRNQASQYPGLYPQQQNPSQDYPQQQYPPTQSPQQIPSPDYSRQLQYTQMQPPQGYFGMDSDQSQMASIQPDELPSLLSASQTGSLPAFGQKGMGSSGTGTSGPTMPSDLGSIGSSLGSSTGSLLGNQNSTSGFSRQARLEDQTRFPLQEYSYPKPPQQPMLRHRPNPYADVPSLYDLYAQYSKRTPRLERFGEDVFINGTGNLDELPMDLPAGPDYVVGPGDGLTISLTGGISQRLERVVDREGRIALPEVGAVEVSGRSMGDVQHLVQTVLRGQFRGVDADVSLSRIRTVRVYVTGDVERPGPYDVSSLSTPLNALYLAGGPTSGGSLRILRHYRGKQLIQ